MMWILNFVHSYTIHGIPTLIKAQCSNMQQLISSCRVCFRNCFAYPLLLWILLPTPLDKYVREHLQNPYLLILYVFLSFLKIPKCSVCPFLKNKLKKKKSEIKIALFSTILSPSVTMLIQQPHNNLKDLPNVNGYEHLFILVHQFYKWLW